MVINSEEKHCLKKISEFENLMIETAATDKDDFKYEGKNYNVYSDGVFVQTIVENRVLFRIYMDKDKNKDYIFNSLFKYF